MLQAEAEDDELADKSVISLALRIMQRVSEAQSEEQFGGGINGNMEDLQANADASKKSARRLQSDKPLHPVDRTEHIEAIQDQYRMQAADGLYKLAMRAFVRNMGERQERGETHIDMNEIDRVIARKMAAAICLAFEGFWTADNHLYRKSFPTEKRAKFIQRILQNTYMSTSWIPMDDTQSSEIQVRHAGDRFEVVLPSEVLSLIVQNENQHIREHFRGM